MKKNSGRKVAAKPEGKKQPAPAKASPRKIVKAKTASGKKGTTATKKSAASSARATKPEASRAGLAKKPEPIVPSKIALVHEKPQQIKRITPILKTPAASTGASRKPELEKPKAVEMSRESTSSQSAAKEVPAALASASGKRAIPSSKAKKPGKRPERVARETPELTIPSILLEGDAPSAAVVSGPGARYALAPQPVVHAIALAGGELPDAYGTGRVFIAARDPHWLYVSWDFTNEQQRRLNNASRDGHLILRVVAEDERSLTVPEVHVHPESKNWFVHVPKAETIYRAEIGYYESGGKWKSVSASQNTLTPREAPSKDISAEFATIPAEVTFQEVVEAVQGFVSVSVLGSQPLLEIVAQATEARQAEEQRREQIAPADVSKSHKRKVGRTKIPIQIQRGKEWTPEQTRALTRLIHVDSYRRVWMGSMEITELVRRQLEEEISSIALVEAKRAAEEMGAPGINISSPFGGEFRKDRRFWFKVNAELIVYGATEPNAKVTIGGRQIKLRPDGTFSFRFSLPDGQYRLPAVAISSDGEEGREARLEFSRSTEYRGDVGAHAQDAALRPPRVEHVH